MQCLKCGKKTKDEQVFCPQCLTVMENYPVKADVRIQLPSRPKLDASKKSGKKRRVLSPEEQIAILRSRQRRLVAIAAALVLLLGAACTLLMYNVWASEELEWGTNYTFDSPFD